MLPPPSEDTQFAEEMRLLRARAGNPSYRAIGESADVSHVTISRVMSGGTPPSWETAEAVITVLGGDPAVFRRCWEDAQRGARLRSDADRAVTLLGQLRTELHSVSSRLAALSADLLLAGHMGAFPALGEYRIATVYGTPFVHHDVPWCGIRGWPGQSEPGDGQDLPAILAWMTDHHRQAHGG